MSNPKIEAWQSNNSVAIDRLINPQKYKGTICFDFDGVIHSYTSGWCGECNIPDAPVDGIVLAIRELECAGFQVVVCSSRAKTENGKMAIVQYLDKIGLTGLAVFAEKPPAKVYIDDRALCFDGNATGLLDKIISFKTWQEKGGAK